MKMYIHGYLKRPYDMYPWTSWRSMYVNGHPLMSMDPNIFMDINRFPRTTKDVHDDAGGDLDTVDIDAFSGYQWMSGRSPGDQIYPWLSWIPMEATICK